MPHIPLVVPDPVHKDAIRVLITGFGPFASYEVNPSWLAVRPLHNVILEPSSVEPVTVSNQQVLSSGGKTSRPIHITSLKVPVTYADVLSIVPNVHARPPILPPPINDDQQFTGSTLPLLPDPPEAGYDFVLHVGAGRQGNLRVETLGHKLGYNLPDVDGKLAPVVKHAKGDIGKGNGKPDEAEAFERSRVSAWLKDKTVRGFAEGYEKFDEELFTSINVNALVHELHNAGVNQVEPSTNAGRYLCDFIFYCSLAEAQRTRSQASASGNGKSKDTKVLFVHCPPVGKPLETEYVTNALRQVVLTICGQA